MVVEEGKRIWIKTLVPSGWNVESSGGLTNVTTEIVWVFFLFLIIFILYICRRSSIGRAADLIQGNSLRRVVTMTGIFGVHIRWNSF